MTIPITGRTQNSTTERTLFVASGGSEKNRELGFIPHPLSPLPLPAEGATDDNAAAAIAERGGDRNSFACVMGQTA